jgi:hypothetical protein
MAEERMQTLMALYGEAKRKNEELTEMAKKRRNTASVEDEDENGGNADGTDSDDLETLSRSTILERPVVFSNENDFAEDEVDAQPQFDVEEVPVAAASPTQEVVAVASTQQEHVEEAEQVVFAPPQPAEEEEDDDDEEELLFIAKTIDTLEKASRDLFANVKIVALGTMPKIEKLLKSKSNSQAPLTLVVVPEEDGFLSASALLEDEKDARFWLNQKKKIWIVTLRNLIETISVESPAPLPANLECYKRRDLVLVPSFFADQADSYQVSIQKSRVQSTLQRLMTQKLKLTPAGYAVHSVKEMMTMITEKVE